MVANNSSRAAEALTPISVVSVFKTVGIDRSLRWEKKAKGQQCSLEQHERDKGRMLAVLDWRLQGIYSESERILFAHLPGASRLRYHCFLLLHPSKSWKPSLDVENLTEDHEYYCIGS